MILQRILCVMYSLVVPPRDASKLCDWNSGILTTAITFSAAIWSKADFLKFSAE